MKELEQDVRQLKRTIENLQPVSTGMYSYAGEQALPTITAPALFDGLPAGDASWRGTPRSKTSNPDECANPNGLGQFASRNTSTDRHLEIPHSTQFPTHNERTGEGGRATMPRAINPLHQQQLGGINTGRVLDTAFGLVDPTGWPDPVKSGLIDQDQIDMHFQL